MGLFPSYVIAVSCRQWIEFCRFVEIKSSQFAEDDEQRAKIGGDVMNSEDEYVLTGRAPEKRRAQDWTTHEIGRPVRFVFDASSQSFFIPILGVGGREIYR